MTAPATPASKRRPAAKQVDPAARVLRHFRIVYNAVRQHFRHLEKSAGLSGAEIWALSQVAANPGIGVGGLAHALDIHQSTASNLLRALLDARLVTSERTSEDRRLVHLHATARGMRLLAKTPTPFSSVLPDALQRLDPRTLARLDRDLGKLIEELPIADQKGAGVLIGEDQ